IGAIAAREKAEPPGGGGKLPYEPLTTPPEPEAAPRERMLDALQSIVTEALKSFPPDTPRKPRKPAEPSQLAARATRIDLAFQAARDEVERVKREIDDELEGARPRARALVGRTRRFGGGVNHGSRRTARQDHGQEKG